MVAEGIQNYVEMAAGLTKATRAKATAAAKNLIATAGLQDVAADASDRVNRLTEEIMAASRANRELMGKLVAAEVDKAAAKLGFVRAEELDQLRREIADLRLSTAHPSADVDASPPAARLREPDDPPDIEPITDPEVDSGAALRAATKKTAAKKAAVKKSAAKKTAAKHSPARKSPAKKSPAKKKPATAAEQAPEAAPGPGALGEETAS